MKTFYMKTTLKLLRLLPALIFFMLALAYNARAQNVEQNPICYGQPIKLSCDFLFYGGCGLGGSTYNWTTLNGSWTSNLQNPIINVGEPGYGSDRFYLSVQYTSPPGGFSGGSIKVTVFNQIIVHGVATPVKCFGGSDGTVSLTSVTGGAAPYTYNWTGPAPWPGATTQNITGLNMGDYTVQVTDRRGCKNILKIVHCTQPPIVNCDSAFYADSTNTSQAKYNVGGPASDLVIGVDSYSAMVSCFGTCDGQITSSASGGTAPYTYVWNSPNGYSYTTTVPNGPVTINYLCTGVYNLSVTDANGCVKTLSRTIDTPAEISVTPSITNVNCFGGNTGAIALTVGGGTPGFTFMWTGPSGFASTDEDITGLIAGDYAVTVTDNNSCTKVGNYTVTEQPLLTVSAVVDSVNCFGYTDGSITATPNGGTPDYTYSWIGPGGPAGTTATISNLGVGLYSLTVTDLYGCTAFGSWTVYQPETLSATLNITNLTCFNSNDGAIETTVSGGTAPYSFSWTGNSAYVSTDQNLVNLHAGDYYLTITDFHGCIFVDSKTVTQPDLLTVSFSHQAVSCFNGSDGALTAIPAGGTPGFTYSWTGPNGYVGTGDAITGLLAGMYYVTVTDANNCTATGSYDLTQPTQLTFSAVADSVDCFGQSNGSITSTPDGGTPTYSFLWSGPSGYSSSAQNLVNLIAGTYYVTLTDFNGCKVYSSVDVYEPGELILGTDATYGPVSCNGYADGSITPTSIVGGTTPYYYMWNTGASTLTLSGIGAGTYSLTVTDFHGCFDIQSFTIGQPDAITVSFVMNPVLCNGGATGSLEVSSIGGNGGYLYNWTGPNGYVGTGATISGLYAGVYNVTSTDSKGCTGTGLYEVTQPAALYIVSSVIDSVNCQGDSDGSISVVAGGGLGSYTYNWTGPDAYIGSGATITGLAQGTYYLTVTDGNACTLNANYTVYEPGILQWTGITDSVNCFGNFDGSISTTSVTGGTAPFYYYWVGPNGFSADQANLTGLGAGVYNLTLTDYHGCLAFSSREVFQPAELIVGTEATYGPISCNGAADGTITPTNITGGTPSYHYMWNTGANTLILSGATAGTYTLTVTDFHGCSDVQSFTIGQPDAVTVTVNMTPVLCNAGNTGTLTASSVGGNGGFTYYWLGPNGFTADGAAITGLYAGMYYVTATDVKGCTGIGSSEVTQPPALYIVSSVVDSVNCQGESDGSISVVAGGGFGSYTYNWTGPDAYIGSGATITGLAQGTYYLTVTDGNACTLNANYTVYEPGKLQWSGVTDSVNCFGNFDGSITTTSVTGGTAPFYYYWVGPNGFTADQANLTGLGAGVYSLTLTDYHGCLAFSSREVFQPAELIVGTEATYGPISCNGAADGTITPTNITGGTPSYHYMWNTGANTLTLSGATAGTYTLTVTDFHGCSDVQSFTIGQPDPVTVTFAMTPVVCFGTATGTLTAEGHGGTGTVYNYSWTGPNGYIGTGAAITGLYAGTYNVSVTDVNNCLGTGSYEVTTPAALVITNAVIDSVNCQGDSDGSISVTVAGGIPNYYYYWEGPNAFTANTSTITGLGFGIYNLTVTDQNACALTTQYEVFEPGKLQWTGITDSVNCFGNFDGAITTTSTTGGTMPYYYYWTGPNGFTANTPNLTGLEAGTYYITVTDYHGCIAFSNRIVYQPDLLDISTSATITKPTCYTGSDGSITGVSVNGGTLPYTYLWSNGTTTLNNFNLPAGAYTLSVTDWHGCTDAQDFIVPDQDPWDFNILGPAQVCCNTSTINDTAVYTSSALTGAWAPPVSWEWGVEGGIIVSGQNTNSIKVVWSCCGTGKVYLTVTQGPNNCQLTKELPVVITPTPAPVISGPISVTANSTTTYSVVNGDPTHLYTWNVVGGSIKSGNGSPTIVVEWGNYPPCGCGEVTVCESTQITPGVPGCTGCATMLITIMPNPLARSIYGFVTYKNGFSTGLNGVTVNLRDVTSNTIVATTVTGPNMNPDSLFAGYPGYYEFQIGSGMIAGSQYKLESSFNGAWGGNNATDALLIQLHIVGTVNLGLAPYGPLNLGVADVNGSNSVSGLDALYVKLRTVGSISSYPAGDWKFDAPVVAIPASGSLRNDYNGLCFGDVNGSYIPTGLKELSFLSVVDDKTQTVPVDETFAYTIRSNAKAQLGAMTLYMGYDPAMFEVVDVASQNDEMKYVIEDGHVAIAWADTKPMSVQSDDQLFTLNVKAKAPVTEATPIFNVKSGSEFADALGTRYDNFELKMSKVITPTGSNEFTLFNYPNPFNVETKVVYTLPEAGQVKLVITDMYGKSIRTLVDDTQDAGTHAITVNGAELNLTAGIYLYRIEVSGATENYVRVNKLIFAR